MCSEIFSRKINYSSCNLSSFKDKSVRQIFWKAILEQNDSVRFSDGWSESKSRTFYFLTSSFSRICLFRFSADKILTKRASSENKIRTRGGEGSFERSGWPRFLNYLHTGNSFHASCDFSDDASAECPHPFLSSDWFRSDGIGFDFLPLPKENTKRLGWISNLVCLYSILGKGRFC